MNQTHDAKKQYLKQYRSTFVPLVCEERTHVDTACAAYHLGRRPQTMRAWASSETGPLSPKRINGRLSWSVADIRQLLGIQATC